METPDDETTDWDATATDTPPSLPSVFHAPHSENTDGTDKSGEMSARHWRPALNRWLLTLNPGRTQDEYEKAVRYFFETPGVPQQLSEVTADLLLAYRGSLALRADRRRRSVPRHAATSPRRNALWTSGAATGAIPGDTDTWTDGQRRGAAQATSLRQGPLSPATVNIRLTALRQFLLFASEHDALPTALTAERIRSALRRLRNERRRPYQVLAEEEWGDFLQAALSPLEHAPVVADAPAPTPAAPAAPAAPRGPWGMTRAAREQQRAATEASTQPSEEEIEAQEQQSVGRAPGRERRTGAHTAQRDHALISLALATGLRAIELSLLDVGDLVSERRRGRTEWWLSLPDEKTKGQRGGRTLPLAPELMATLFAYLRSTGRSWDNPDHRATPLFLALKGGRPPLADRTVSQAVAQAYDEPERRYRRLRPEQIRGVIHRVEAQWQAQRRAAAATAATDETPELASDNLHLSPHALRHSAAIALLLGDEASDRPPASVEHVRGWLGHFDIRTTQRYLAHIESRDQRRRFAIRPQTRPAQAEAATDATAAPSQPTLFDGE